MQAPALSSLSATKQFESKKTEKENNKIVIQILDSSAVIHNKKCRIQYVGCHDSDLSIDINVCKMS